MKPKLIIFIITFLFTTYLLTSSIYAATYDWKGGSSTAWDTPSNWSPSRTTPLSSDALQIGVVSFTNPPTITTSTSSATTSCASVTFGTATSSITLTVNGTLSVSGAILQNPPTLSLLGLGGTITTTLAGTGSITCGSMQVGSTTFLSVGAITVNQVTVVSTVNSLQINGDLSIYGTSNSVVVLLVTLLQTNNSAFYLRGGTTTISGQIYTNTSAASGGILNISLLSAATATFTIDVPSGSTLTPRLVLTNPAPIKSTSNAASIDFYNNGGGSGTCTVEYAGSGQSVYTESTSQLDINPTAYQNINFSATGTKTINSGDLTVYGDWNSASTSGKVDAVTNNPNVIFKGATQSLSDAGSDGGNGVVFKNVFVQGSATKTMSASGSGKFAVSSSGVLTMGGTATLAAGGVLTLNSDATGSATVASIPSGTAITGNLNVQRYINGGATKYRGYRLLTSSVNTGTSSPVFTLAYLKNNAFVTGTTLAAGGFDVSPGANNPTIYFFKESQPANQSSFTSGYFRGVNSLTSPYSFDAESGTRYIGAGNGFAFFFRGDRTAAGSINNAIYTTYVPQPTTMTETGILNQGNITVANWYDGTSTLQYSSVAANTLQGYNLVGNPYASTINFEKFNRKGTSGSTADKSSSIYISGQKAQIYTTTPSKVPPLVYIWIYNPTTKNFESYQQYAGPISSVNDTTTTVNPGIQSVPGGVASNMIASGQGFFIIANGSGQALSFRESAKTTTQPSSTTLAGVFSLPQGNTPIAQALSTGNKAIMSAANTPLAAASVSEPVSQPSPVIHLLLEKDTANFDGVALVFDSWATANFNKDKDAEDLGGIGALESFSALTSDSVKTSIHHLPLPGKTQGIIPLFADATTSGPYKIKLTDIKDMPALYEVWLKDNFTKDSVDLKAHPDYSFNIDKSNNASFGVNRLQLIIRQNPALMVHLLIFEATKLNETAKATWFAENEANYTTYVVERSTNNGKTFGPIGTLNSNGAKSYSFTDKAPAQGLNQYRLKQIDLNGNFTYSKIAPVMFANNTQNTISSIMSLYPNPATDVINAKMKIDNNSNFNYKISITNSEGKIIATATSSQANWQNNVASFIPGTYIMQVVNSKDNSVIGFQKFIKQ
ncbi:hypothetical protein SAMN05192574_103323 [Mucilaginibacter gossypiicola]|uniref:Secretion system C-terminal sorting domain-containing protein n=1 Tax=Mucilaginibacter gossypiicola TaxID=551995 RepID=A0A1H8GZH1_9SPHI|nr:T9SS type A sorting domain-containing protein [Mucilaginibacter gossypiicola]SEN49114.1 hypothetical protein SAMN05192574_103323 [Mucilaginibacter gossypiicola]